MENIWDLKEKHKEALDRAKAALPAEGYAMSPAQTAQYEKAVGDAEAIQRRINACEARNTIRRFDPVALLEAGRGDNAGEVPTGHNPLTRTAQYAQAFHKWLTSKGAVSGEALHAGSDGLGGFLLPRSERLARDSNIPTMNAALDEGTPGSGGYAVPSVVMPQIVPLGMPDLGIFNEATVIPTVSDQKWPIQQTFGQAAAKAESGASTNAFQEIDPTIGQFTLSAFMVGGLRLLSWELVMDVPQFQSFATDDLIRSQLLFEGAWYVTGTGTNQAQGLIGNTGTGTGAPYQLTGANTDGQLLLNAVFDVVGTLKAAYQPNAVFVMNRATAMTLRRAQLQANLYIPALTTDADGTLRLLGYRVAFDANMPSLPAATSTGVVPILFGSFKDGYLIGVRGGAGINIKVLDQPFATSGQLALVAYRRVDARVRRSEAIQAITISHT